MNAVTGAFFFHTQAVRHHRHAIAAPLENPLRMYALHRFETACCPDPHQRVMRPEHSHHGLIVFALQPQVGIRIV